MGPFIENCDITTTESKSIRLKVTDSCQWNCKFCHNEGNIVALDISENDRLLHTFEKIQKELGINEIHLTGGEPTLNKEIAHIIDFFTKKGIKVKMTSNGQFSADLLDKMHTSGLGEINFSMQGLDPYELLLTQEKSQKGTPWAINQIKTQINNILYAKMKGLKVKINTVISSVSDAPKILKIYNWCRENGVEFRLLDDLSNKETARLGIIHFLQIIGAECLGASKDKLSSGIKYIFRDNSTGYIFKIKQIDPIYLHFTCNDCPNRKNESCQEGFYGIRMQKVKCGITNVLLCMQNKNANTLMSLENFMQSSQLAEIKKIYNS